MRTLQEVKKMIEEKIETNNTKERYEITKNNENKFGTEAKRIRWKVLSLETKNNPHEPKSIIIGEVDCIFPTGDIAFKKILKMFLWYPEKDEEKEIKIPQHYLKSKKIVIRREIIASLQYIEELKEAEFTIGDKLKWKHTKYYLMKNN